MANLATQEDIAKVNRRIDLLAVKVGANTDGVRSVKGTFSALQSFADTAKTEQQGVRAAIERVVTGWDYFSARMGFARSGDRHRQPQGQQAGGPSVAVTPASSTTTVSVSKGTARSASVISPTPDPQPPKKTKKQTATTSKGGDIQMKRKTNVKRPAQQRQRQNAPKRKKDKEGLRMGVAIGSVMWAEQPETTRGGRMKYPISGGGCLIAYKKPPRFTQAQLKKEIRKQVKENGGVSLQVPPESMEEWARFCKACSESVFALFLSSLKDVSDDTPVYLLERIVEEVENDDYDGFISRQPQPLRAAMEAVLSETCFGDIEHGGLVDKRQLLMDTARAACEWHAVLLDGNVPGSFTDAFLSV